jgi:hypothetical protein
MKRDIHNQIPEKHYCQEMDSAYKHMLQFYFDHPTRPARKGWLIGQLQQYGLAKKRWSRSKFMWPIGQDVFVCRKCFCSLYNIDSCYVSRTMKEVDKGSGNKVHGNTHGAGRDGGRKSMQIQAGLDAVRKKAGCDIMPHSTAIRTPFSTRSELMANVVKVTYYTALT